MREFTCTPTNRLKLFIHTNSSDPYTQYIRTGVLVVCVCVRACVCVCAVPSTMSQPIIILHIFLALCNTPTHPPHPPHPHPCDMGGGGVHMQLLHTRARTCMKRIDAKNVAPPPPPAPPPNANEQVFRVKKLVGRQWGAPNSNYLLAMGWPLLSCHV